MANLNYRTIVAIGEKENNTREAITAAAMYPGTLVEITSAGADTRYADGDKDIKTWAQNTIQAQSTASIQCQRAIVMENDYLGLGVETQIPISTQIRYYICEPGDQINFRFTGALNIAKGTKLEADGAGGLKAYNAGVPLFTAQETINPGAGVSNLYRIEAI